MLKVKEVEKITIKLKTFINTEIKEENYEDALNLISACANVLYQTNIRYYDEELEQGLGIISNKVIDYKFFSTIDDNVLFWDGFGLDFRGLARIYIKALGALKKLIYVTYKDRKDMIPETISLVRSFGGEVRFIKREKLHTIDSIQQLNAIVREVSPRHIFLYSAPDDVVATTVLYAYEGVLKRYQINLTDHAFWLGAGCIDTCIEFRNYGASITKEYRKINEKRIVVIPYYAVVDKEKVFQGYPFELKEGQKVIFSGGSLYKTQGDDGKYYQMVTHILESHPEAVFWYAGSGDDSGLKNLMEKYPGRVVYTAERDDLFQVMEHCDVYLSTYPMAGGLMTQYAAMAGKVPLTLKSIVSSEEILRNYDKINVEFDEPEKLYGELDKLLGSEKYKNERAGEMCSSVITAEQFQEEIDKLLKGENSDYYPVIFKHIDNKKVIDLYLSRHTGTDVDAMVLRRSTIRYMLLHSPIEAVRGGGYYYRESSGSIDNIESNYLEGNTMEEPIEASLVCVNYRPALEKLILSLNSLVMQEGKKYEVVVTDDGSENAYFAEVIYILEKRGIREYTLAYLWKNEGIVRNLLCGLQLSRGQFVRGVSPGDVLANQGAVSDWIDFLKNSGRGWSIGDTAYYRMSDGHIQLLKMRAHPGDLRAYRNNDEKGMRKGYLFYDDIALGASLIYERSLMLEYLIRINGKIVYAEDNSFRMMMFDNVMPAYYPKNILFYEYGDGISTSGERIWGQRLRKDWDAANTMMLQCRIEGDSFQKQYVDIIRRRKRTDEIRSKMPLIGKLIGRMDRLRISGMLGHMIHIRKNPQMTNDNVEDSDLEFLNKCMKGYEEIEWAKSIR